MIRKKAIQLTREHFQNYTPHVSWVAETKTPVITLRKYIKRRKIRYALELLGVDSREAIQYSLECDSLDFHTAIYQYER